MTDQPWEKNEYFWIAMINNKHISYKILMFSLYPEIWEILKGRLLGLKYLANSWNSEFCIFLN